MTRRISIKPSGCLSNRPRWTIFFSRANLALVYGNKSFIYRANDPQWEEKGFAAVRKALALDPNAAEALQR